MTADRQAEIRHALFERLKDLSVDLAPIDLIEDIATLEGFLSDYARARIEEARAAGASWFDIAQRLGVSKQAAHKRFTTKRYTPKIAALEFRFDLPKRKPSD